MKGARSPSLALTILQLSSLPSIYYYLVLASHKCTVQRDGAQGRTPFSLQRVTPAPRGSPSPLGVKTEGQTEDCTEWCGGFQQGWSPQLPKIDFPPS